MLPSQVQISSSWLAFSFCSTALWRSSHASSRCWRFWLWLPRLASPPAPPVAFWLGDPQTVANDILLICTALRNRAITPLAPGALSRSPSANCQLRSMSDTARS